MSAPAQSSNNAASTQRPPLAILIAATGLAPMALNIFIPSMPGLVDVLGTDYGTIQLSLTFYLAGLAVAQLFMGPLSDRFGRRPVLLGGLVVFLAGSLMAGLADSVALLLAGRIVQAVGGCSGMVLGRAIVRDTCSREESASMIGYITMVMVIAPMIAPALGGYLDVWLGWRATFFTVFAAGLVVLAFAWLLLNETHHHRRVGDGPLAMAANFGLLLRDAAFAGYVVTISCTTGVFFAFLAGAPYIMVEILDRPPSEYGEYFVLNALSYMAGNFASGRLATRIAPERMIFAGCFACLLGVALLTTLALTIDMVPIAIFGPVMLVGIGNGLCLPSATASALSLRPHLAGTASGLVGCVQMAAGALATLIVGSLQDDTVFPMVAVMSASAVLACLGFLMARAALGLRAAAAAEGE